MEMMFERYLHFYVKPMSRFLEGHRREENILATAQKQKIFVLLLGDGVAATIRKAAIKPSGFKSYFHFNID